MHRQNEPIGVRVFRVGSKPAFWNPCEPLLGDAPRAPGGSSAGSAVAVAAGLVPLAVGTDTAGSVRVPAAFCGITGFKSSQTHYDKTGVFPLSESLDSIGTFAHNVEDLITFDQILRGDPISKQDKEATKPDLIIPESIVFDGIEQDILACFDLAVDRLVEQGFHVVRKSFPIFDEVTALFAKHGTLTVAEAATVHAELLASPNAALMDQRVRERMLTASQFTAQDYITLQWQRARLQDAVSAQLGRALLLFPTVAMTAPSIKELEADDDLFVKKNLLALRNTMLGNYLGMPGVSIPIGTSKAGLPIGMLFSGANSTDIEVLRAVQSIKINRGNCT